MESLVLLLRSARPVKAVPLVLVMLNAALLPGARPDAAACLVAVGFVLGISVFGTRLNILTDFDLDRSRKPHLFASLTRSPALLRATLAVELALSLLLLALAARLSAPLGLALLLYGLAFVLYSYNFITFWNPRANRLKVFWWGNACAVMSGYAALWLAGFACAGLSPGGASRWLLSIAAGAVLIDYGVFLNECAGDAEEERSHGLETLPSLLGARRTSQIGLALSSIGGAALVAGAHRLLVLGRGRAAVALLFYLAVQGLGCLGSLPFSRRSRGGGRWEALLDSAFWISRAGMLAILLVS
jgi:4-hydroxybenzoate polyprenyltransferase